MTAADHRRNRSKISCIDGGIHTWTLPFADGAVEIGNCGIRDSSNARIVSTSDLPPGFRTID